MEKNISVGFSEKFSERRFPYLYDKTSKLFKDKNANWNASAKVAEELSLEGQARNQKLFRAGESSWNLGILINI